METGVPAYGSIFISELVIFAQPFGEIEAMVQGGGRGGRKRSDGLRNTVQVYQLVNGEDLKLTMSNEMRGLLTERRNVCSRDYLKKYYGGVEEEKQDESTINCCQYHDNIVYSVTE